MKIDNYISELLYDHDCVIVTDLGGFIANYNPASINPALHVINPPSKKLAFNSSLKNNDGLLASHIAQRTALNYLDASDVVREYVKEAQKNLKSGQKLKIEKVGVLYLDTETNIQFLPDQNVNYLVSSFGLPALHSPVIKREVTAVAEQNIPKVIPFNLPEQKVKTSRKPFKWKVIEVVPAAAVLAFLFMLPPVVNEFNNNLSTLLPFSRMNEYINEWKGESTETPHAIKFEYKSPFEVPPANSYLHDTPVNPSDEPLLTKPDITKDLNQEVISSAPIAEIKTGDEPIATPVTIDVANKKYFVIGGCFRLQSNAEKFITEMQAKGNEAVLIGKNNGLYMVSLFSSDSFVQTTDALPEIKSTEVENAWIYTK